MFIPVLTVYNGWILSIVWSWFMVPLGLPTLSIAHGIGVICVMVLLFPGLHQLVREIPNKIDKWKEQGLNAKERMVKIWLTLPIVILAPIWTLLIAYIAHLFM